MYAHALDRERYSQTQINVLKLTAAIDTWAIFACKRDCVLRVKVGSQCSARCCVALRLLLVVLRCVADARSQCLRLDARSASGHIIIEVS